MDLLAKPEQNEGTLWFKIDKDVLVVLLHSRTQGTNKSLTDQARFFIGNQTR